MYSLYDVYKNDMDEKYTASKEKGASLAGTAGRTVSPFVSQPQATIPQDVTLSGSGTQPSTSLYDYNEQYTPNPTREEIYGDVDWTQYPSPKGFEWAANNLMLPAFTMGAGIGGGLPGAVIMGTAGDIAKRHAAGKDTDFMDVLRMGGTRALTGIVNQYTPNLSNNPFVNMAADNAKSSLTSKAVNWLFGLWNGDVSEEGMGAGQAGAEAGKKAAEGLLKGNVSEEELSGGEYDTGSNVPSDWSGYDWGEY